MLCHSIFKGADTLSDRLEDRLRLLFTQTKSVKNTDSVSGYIFQTLSVSEISNGPVGGKMKEKVCQT